MSIIASPLPPVRQSVPHHTVRAEELLSRIKDFAVNKETGQLYEISKGVCPNCAGTRCNFCDHRGVYVTKRLLRATVAIIGGN